MPLDVNFYQQIAVGTAVDAYIALVADTDTLTGIHTGRNLDLNLVGAANLALALTGGTGILDDLATAGTLGTGHG